jgi:hypothetical protein
MNIEQLENIGNNVRKQYQIDKQLFMNNMYNILNDIQIKPSTLNIYFLWVGKYPSSNILTQIRSAINSVKRYNPQHKVYLFSNVISHYDVNCTVVPVNCRQLYKNTPMEQSNVYPIHEHYKGNVPPVYWSDLFRYILLWKYGGTYIDSDDICIRPLPTENNIIAASCIESDNETIEYNGGISNKYVSLKHNWRTGNDPLVNFVPKHPLFHSLLTEINNSKIHYSKWGQILPTQILKKNIDNYKEVYKITVYPWHDLLYHPKHDGHASCDQRYKGNKIKWNDKPSEYNIKLLTENYKFFIVKNHNWNQSSKIILTSLMNYNK